MSYDFLVNDITRNLSQKAIGTDKGLAKIGDGIVNLTYSVAKSIYLTKQGKNSSTIRTGLKVSRNILAEALKRKKSRRKTRTPRHAVEKRLQDKKQRSLLKQQRSAVHPGIQ